MWRSPRPAWTRAAGWPWSRPSSGSTADDACVFGDMPNDVPMFEWAGWRRVAVANAHPEVLALADEVTASNDADGVAAWLEALLSS